MKPPTALDGDKFKIRKDPMKYQAQPPPPGWFRRIFWLGWRKWVIILALYLLSFGPASRYGTSWARLPLVVIYSPILILTQVPVIEPYLFTYMEYWSRRSSCNDGAAAAGLKTFHGMMQTYRRRGYADQGSTFPVGFDDSVPNSGKYCGLYYELNDAGEKVTLIGVSDANADYRAVIPGSKPVACGNGFYIPATGTYTPTVTENGQVKSMPAVNFDIGPKQGYWFALMKYYSDDNGIVPYDREFAEEHFAIVAFPDDYGASGTMTFIINEEGTVYAKDLGRAEYIGIYPGPDPTKHGWEIAK